MNIQDKDLIQDTSNMEWLQEFDDFENVFKIHGVLVENNKPDFETVTIDEDCVEGDLQTIITRHFGANADYVEMIIANNIDDEHCKLMCPYLRFFLFNIGPKVPINYKLENIFKRSNAKFSPSRCEKALIFGLFSRSAPNKFANVPFEFQSFITSREPSDAIQNPLNITGIFKQLPIDLHWNILKYMIHPCAEMMKKYWNDFDQWWYMRFMDLIVCLDDRFGKSY